MLQRLVQIATCGCHLIVSGLHVALSYTRRTTHNGILKNCTVANIAIKAFLRV